MSKQDDEMPDLVAAVAPGGGAMPGVVPIPPLDDDTGAEGDEETSIEADRRRAEEES